MWKRQPPYKRSSFVPLLRRVLAGRGIEAALAAHRATKAAGDVAAKVLLEEAMTYEALYSPNLGLVGFRCRHSAQCKKLTRTERGMWMHLQRVHRVERQGRLFDEAKERNELQSVRAANVRHTGPFADITLGSSRRP